MESKNYYYICFGVLGLVGYLIYRDRNKKADLKSKVNQYNSIKADPSTKKIGQSSPASTVEIQKKVIEESEKPIISSKTPSTSKEPKIVTTKFTKVDKNGVEWIQVLTHELSTEPDNEYYWVTMTDGYIPYGGEFESYEGHANPADKAIREMNGIIYKREKELAEEIALESLKQTFSED